MTRPTTLLLVLLLLAVVAAVLGWMRPTAPPSDTQYQRERDSLASVANEANARSKAYLAYADSCAHVADSLSRIRLNPEAVILEAARGLGSPDVDSFRVILTEPSK